MTKIYWTPGTTLENIEKQTILMVWNFFGQNNTRAAESLGITPRTIYNKLKEYGVVKEEEAIDHDSDPRFGPTQRGDSGSTVGDSEASEEGVLRGADKGIKRRRRGRPPKSS